MTSRIILCLLLVACTSVESPGEVADAASGAIQPPCNSTPTGVATSDYFLSFKVPEGLLPDPNLAGRSAKIAVHRLRPLYQNGKCPGVPTRVAVLIHGRTTPAPPVFDLRRTTGPEGALSIQEDLARAGIETFAPSLLGYGRSTRFEALSDACNASLPAYPADPNAPCTNPNGCDRTHSAIFPLNQQVTTLNVNPLAGETCAHSSPYRFGGADVWVRDIRQVIDDAIAKTGVSQVVMVSYSFGSQSVGRALFAPRNADLAAKISKVAFVSPIFLQPNGDENPTDDTPPPNVVSFPLYVVGRSSFHAVYGLPTAPVNIEAQCAGHVLAGTDDDYEQQAMGTEDVGLAWGGTDPNQPAGVMRAPTFSHYGFNRTVAAQINVPTLVMQGTDDPIMVVAPPPGTTEPRRQGCELYKALPDANRVLVRIECASHGLFSEGCDPAQARCQGAAGVTPYGGANAGEGWAGPHHTLTTALIEFIRSSTFTIPGQTPVTSGSYVVTKTGEAMVNTPSASCP